MTIRSNAITAFSATYGRKLTILVRSPGRVNLLGAHVDYNDGWVLPAAIDRAIWLAAAPTDGERVRIKSLDMAQSYETNTFDLIQGQEQIESQGAYSQWCMIPAGVAWALDQENHSLAGLEAVFAGDIPIGAGVSSSAAVEVAFIMAWEAVSNLNLSDVQRARIGKKVENDYLGLDSGIMDQFACIHGKKDALIYLDCRTLDYELIPFPENTAILIADTGIRRQLTHSEYNLRRKQCQEALAILSQYLPEIRALRDVDIEKFNLYAHQLPDPLQKRARHVVEECARVNDGAAALIKGDLDQFGQFIQDSHISSRDLYEVSIVELDVLAESCWDIPGCLGARLTGAGFGGCVVALVEGAATSSIKEKMESVFFSRFGRLPAIFSCQVADGAEIYEL